MIKYTDMSSVPYFAYNMADLINGKHYNNILVYEFHNPKNPESPYDDDSELDLFQERSSQYYKSAHNLFIGTGIVDEFPAIIDIVIKFSNEWFVARDCGSNYYLGTGPHGILHLRKACADNGVKIFYHHFEEVDKWLEGKFGKEAKTTKQAKDKYSLGFERIIKLFGEFTSSIQGTKEQYKDLKEENIRNTLHVALNTIFKGRGFREAKNGKGKTDIMIKTKDGRNEYIFELKIWNGIQSLIDTIDQLCGYLSWHNKYAGIIILSHNKNFTKILNETSKFLQDNYSVFPIDASIENEFRVSIPYQTDKDKLHQVHLTYINLA